MKAAEYLTRPVPMKQIDVYFVWASLLSIASQATIGLRLQAMQRVRDYSPRASWYVVNVALLGLAIVVMLPVLRKGRWWEKAIVPIFCLFPILILKDYVRWSLWMLRQG